MASLKISGRMTVKNLKKNFQSKFGKTLRIYHGVKFAADSDRLGKVADKTIKRGSSIRVSDGLRVKEFETRMMSKYGLQVQVADTHNQELLADSDLLSSAIVETTKVQASKPPIQMSEPRSQPSPPTQPVADDTAPAKDGKQRWFQIFFSKLRLLFANILTLVILISEGNPISVKVWLLYCLGLHVTLVILEIALRGLIKLLKRLKRATTVKTAIFATIILIGYFILRPWWQHQPSGDPPNGSDADNIVQAVPMQSEPEVVARARIAHIRHINVKEPTQLIEIQPRDTLTELSEKHFGKAANWREFLKYNEIPNIDALTPGDQLQIPVALEVKTGPPAPKPTTEPTIRPESRNPPLINPMEPAKVVLAPVSTYDNNPKAIAVIIGNKDYKEQGVPSVRYALNDAQAVRRYLIESLGYRTENIIYLENATQSKFLSVFGNENTHQGRLYDYAQPDGTSDIFVYYSGHGAPDIATNGGYFVPIDSDPARVRLNGYSLNLLYRNLQKVPYRYCTVVIDACFSGSSIQGPLIKNISPLMLPKIEIPRLPESNSILMTSSTGQQVSCWYPDKEHSLFTYYFLEALQGKADTDANKLLTFSEIKQYINQKVPYMARRLHGREQEPQLEGNLNYTFLHLK